MKLVLDENLPHELRPLLMVGHEVFTAAFLGWKAIKNGQLLAMAAAGGFDALITLDRGIGHQQNPASLPCSVVIVMAPSNRIDELRPFVPRILRALHDIVPRTIVWVS